MPAQSPCPRKRESRKTGQPAEVILCCYDGSTSTKSFNPGKRFFSPTLVGERAFFVVWGFMRSHIDVPIEAS